MIDIQHVHLSLDEQRELQSLLALWQEEQDPLQEMWRIMDLIWAQMGCDNRKLDWDKINAFYQHPVWLLNGLFIEQHALSMQHRTALSNWLNTQAGINAVLDYGGGFGTLAKLIAEQEKAVKIDIFEPHVNDYNIRRLRNYPQIRFIDHISMQYDALVCTDVLEHVPDPLLTFRSMVAAVKKGGYLIIANCFSPVIQCHLPQTFHLRYTFKLFARMMGLQPLGALSGSHADLYVKKKTQPVSWALIRNSEQLSKQLFRFVQWTKARIAGINAGFTP